MAAMRYIEALSTLKAERSNLLTHIETLLEGNKSEDVKDILETLEEADELDEIGCEILNRAIRHANTRVVRYLLDTIYIDDIDSVWYLAVEDKHASLEVVKELMLHSDIGLDGVENRVELMGCAASVPIVEYMSNYVPINECDETVGTALHYALRYGKTDNVRFLLENGADPNILDVAGNTAMHTALVRGASVEIVKLLLLHGSKVNWVDANGHTPLSYAIGAGSGPDIFYHAYHLHPSETAVLQALLDAGAKVKKHHLELALRCKTPDTFKLLLENYHGAVHADILETIIHPCKCNTNDHEDWAYAAVQAAIEPKKSPAGAKAVRNGNGNKHKRRKTRA